MCIFQITPLHLKTKYRCYSPTALHKAYTSVTEQGLPVQRASRMYAVPEQTLRDRVNGKINPECVTTGREPVLSMFDEAKLVDHLKTMADYGYGYTRQETADIASEYATQLGKRSKDQPLTIRWMEGFFKRWPEMKVLKPRHWNMLGLKQQMERQLTVILIICIVP